MKHQPTNDIKFMRKPIINKSNSTVYRRVKKIFGVWTVIELVHESELVRGDSVLDPDDNKSVYRVI